MPCKKDGTFSLSCQLRQFLFFTLNPVGHQSTNWIVLLVLTLAIAALTSLGTTSPLYNMQHAMYLPCRGSHFTIWLAGSKHAAERKIRSVDDLLWTFHSIYQSPALLLRLALKLFIMYECWPWQIFWKIFESTALELSLSNDGLQHVPEPVATDQ